MSSLLPWPRRTIFWKCPKCGKETVTVSDPPWGILSCIPLFGGIQKTPICPKCKIKMEKQRSFTI